MFYFLNHTIDIYKIFDGTVEEMKGYIVVYKDGWFCPLNVFHWHVLLSDVDFALTSEEGFLHFMTPIPPTYIVEDAVFCRGRYLV